MKAFSICMMFAALVLLEIAKAQDTKVSSKLDFEEPKEELNSTRNHSNEAGGKAKKISPKIQGVRVTVDTTESKKPLTDSSSKESVEIVDTNKNTKKVEIHTDITFEITDGDDSNATSPERVNKDENDASVPIFKGRGGTTHRPKKPYDPRTRPSPWVPSRPEGDVIHTHHINPDVPVFPRTDDGGIYRGIDSWNNFVPITSVWTTARPYYPVPPPYDPSALRSYQSYADAPQWKPCYCISGVHGGYPDNPAQRKNVVRSTILRVNDKLESPFSNKK